MKAITGLVQQEIKLDLGLFGVYNRWHINVEKAEVRGKICADGGVGALPIVVLVVDYV
jgi:hypothetical protein